MGDQTQNPCAGEARQLDNKTIVIKIVAFLFFLFWQIGVWNSGTGLNLTDSNKDSSTNVTDSMANRTLIVTTILVGRPKILTLRGITPV